MKSQPFWRTHTLFGEAAILQPQGSAGGGSEQETTGTFTHVIIPSHLIFPLDRKSLWFLQGLSVHKASYRALQPRDQASTLLPSIMWNVPVVEGEGRSAVCQGCPQALPATAPGRHWAELVRQPPTPLPSYLQLRVPRDRFNLPNTKKLKYWNAVGFLQSIYPGCWRSHCVFTYIMISLTL